MGRNIERDAREIEYRKNQLLMAGFHLFAEKGIDSVKLQTIADKADVGISTLYNYYQNKVNLVIAISAKIWGDIWKDTLKQHSLEELGGFNAYQLVSCYGDQIIRLYREQPGVLKFSGSYKTFIQREGASEDQLKTQMDVLAPVNVLFHRKYEEAKQDGSIRTDLSEKELFVTVVINMLAIAERYAMGLVWADDHTGDHLQELKDTKQMILDWIRGSQE